VTDSAKRLYVRSAPFVLIAGLITAAAGLGSLSWGGKISVYQIPLIALACLASIVYASYVTFSGVLTASKVDHVDITVTGIATGDKNKAIALLAKVFSLYIIEVVNVLDEPERLVPLIDSSLATLHTTICRCHGIDDDMIKVSLVSFVPLMPAARLGDEPHDILPVRCYPKNRPPRIELNEEISEQMHAVMSRRHPYRNGWLKSKEDGSPSRMEYDVLAPGDVEVASYIRVGIPHLGVLCVDCSDLATPLSVADRELVLAFADILNSPAMAKVTPVATHAIIPDVAG
jgi:hypothetical protein